MRALVVVDVQFCMFFGEWPVPNSDALLNNLGNRILQARTAGELVVFVQNDAPEGELDAPGMPMWQLVFSPLESEPVFRKTTQNVFDSNSKFKDYLVSRNVTELEFAGLQSELCLAASARGAVKEGFKIRVNRNLHSTYNSDLPAEQIADQIQAELESL